MSTTDGPNLVERADAGDLEAQEELEHALLADSDLEDPSDALSSEDAEFMLDSLPAEPVEDRARDAEIERWKSLMGKRLRVHFEDRKMSIPGNVRLDKDGDPVLSTSWGRDYPLLGQAVTLVEVKDPDSGRYSPAS